MNNQYIFTNSKEQDYFIDRTVITLYIPWLSYHTYSSDTFGDSILKYLQDSSLNPGKSYREWTNRDITVKQYLGKIFNRVGSYARVLYMNPTRVAREFLATQGVVNLSNASSNYILDSELEGLTYSGVRQIGFNQIIDPIKQEVHSYMKMVNDVFSEEITTSDVLVNISSLELNWTFSVSSSAGAEAAAASAPMAEAAKATVPIQFLEQIQGYTEGNYLSTTRKRDDYTVVAINFNKSLSMKFYDKTNESVRAEVRLTGRKIKDLLGNKSMPMDFTGFEALTGKLASEYYPTVQDIEIGGNTCMSSNVIGISKACEILAKMLPGDAKLNQEVLETALRKKYIKNNKSIAKSVRMMKKKGILVPTKSRASQGFYTLSPEYKLLLNSIRKNELGQKKGAVNQSQQGTIEPAPAAEAVAVKAADLVPARSAK